jgi:capsular polysaccharide biosynthesis protein
MAKSKLQKLIHDVPSGLFVKFRTLDELYGDTLKTHQVIPSETIATPEVRDLPRFRSILKTPQQETYTSPASYTTVLENVLYWPAQQEIILTPSRQVITESCLHASIPTERFHLDFQQLLRNSKIDTIPGYCSLFRNRRTWAHTLVHNIPRCFLLNQPEYAELDEIKLLCSEGLSDVETFFIPKLIPSNVKIQAVSRHHLYYIEKLILPSFLSQAWSGYLPSVYLNKLHSECLPQRPSKQNRRILISRKQSASTSKGRHILNEDELVAALVPLGFEKISLDGMPISEAIALFYDAKTVIGAHGAGLSHILFSQNINVLELSPTPVINPFYFYMSKSLGHTHRYWCSNETQFHRNFKVNVSQILEQLDHF